MYVAASIYIKDNLFDDCDYAAIVDWCDCKHGDLMIGDTPITAHRRASALVDATASSDACQLLKLFTNLARRNATLHREVETGERTWVPLYFNNGLYFTYHWSYSMPIRMQHINDDDAAISRDTSEIRAIAAGWWEKLDIYYIRAYYVLFHASRYGAYFICISLLLQRWHLKESLHHILRMQKQLRYLVGEYMFGRALKRSPNIQAYSWGLRFDGRHYARSYPSQHHATRHAGDGLILITTFVLPCHEYAFIRRCWFR